VKYLHGAVSYPDGECYFRVLPRMDSGCCIEFLQGLLEQFPERSIRVICDSAPAHRSHAMFQFLERNPRLRLQYQPTYAPWTNPMERVWQELRRSVTHCHDLPNLGALTAAARRWCHRLADRQPEVRRLVSFQGATAS
jgi:putative transposase